ncbi:MAG: anaerobic sulfite reductase subunit AsrB [Omnitrophica bacterium]|nr:anaerobic sulfite reductase subunit AsrB [Candidatus Omnitrophota bacterium]MCQ9207085.1 anaerobic sulfite reductase subunit AsrB [Candidatus Omnitrophota bacterium]
MDNIYLSKKAKILGIRKHTPTEWSFNLGVRTEAVPGQFVMVSLPGAGEVPISISGYNANSIELTIRNVGKVTSHISKINQGDYLYVRGPYGNGFPLQEFVGKHLLIIAGGSAIAPVKPLIEHYINNSQFQVDGMDIIAGFRSPRHILFHDELKQWKKKCEVRITVDRDEDYAWMGSIGFVVDYIKEVQNISEDTRAIIIGPPLMMTNSVRELFQHGVKKENIYLSFERHMKCGTGKCGHCRIRDKYVCLDGPVFNYDEVKELID